MLRYRDIAATVAGALAPTGDPMWLIRELSLKDLWSLLQQDHLSSWDLLQCDVRQFLALQKKARAEGKIPAGPTWDRVSPDEWRLRPGQRMMIVRDGKIVVELPSNSRESRDARSRRRPGRQQKLTNDVLKKHIADHPDLTHAQRAISLTRELGLQKAPLHRQTIARRVRELKKRPKKAPLKQP